MNKAVIGLGFGDEGKGVVVNHLCSLSPDAIVVRFNGGHQAGHNVWKDGNNHVFSNFGSGSMQGNETYWSEHCTVEPVGMMRELTLLEKKGIYPSLYVNYDAPVTTPYDIAENRDRESCQRHGSCGVGFGTTIEREEKACCLHFIDLYYDSILKPKLNNIAKFYNRHLDIEYFLDAVDKMKGKTNINACIDVPQIVRIFSPNMTAKASLVGSIIYEGAQGLLLDQQYGYFPNVSRSNCGTQNIPDPYHVEYFLVTRAYQTRHGNGYMSNEDSTHIQPDKYEQNVHNDWQGAFRKGILDMDLINYAISCDPVLRNHKHKKKHIVITCLDHLKSYKLLAKGGEHTLRSEQSFINAFKHYLETPVESILTTVKNNLTIEVK